MFGKRLLDKSPYACYQGTKHQTRYRLQEPILQFFPFVLLLQVFPPYTTDLLVFGFLSTQRSALSAQLTAIPKELVLPVPCAEGYGLSRNTLSL